MKKNLLLALMASCILSMAGCGNNKDISSSDVDNDIVATADTVSDKTGNENNKESDANTDFSQLKEGDIITLGSIDMETKHDESDGTKENIEWEVLKLSDDGSKALLITTKVIVYKDFDEWEDRGLAVTCPNWNDSKIRAWLNNDFYNEALEDDVKTRIVESDLESIYNFSGGEDYEIQNSTDKIFLLSVDEIKELYGINLGETKEECIVYNIAGKPSGWWSRTGTGGTGVIGITDTGYFSPSGYESNSFRVGVRPAMWIVIE